MNILFVVCIACALVQLDLVQALPHGKAIKGAAETIVEQATEKVNETPQVEHTGGLRKQLLHKATDIASSSLVSKGATMVMSSAAKYPLMAAAAPIALPLAKAAATAIVINQVHKAINGMGKSKNETHAVEESEQAINEEEKKDGSDQKKSLMDKITGAFKTEKSEATDSENPDESKGDDSKTEEPKEETTTTTEKPKLVEAEK